MYNQVNEQDVELIKSWIQQEMYLPKQFDDNLVAKFLYSCDGSLEKTKRCIEEFCTGRAAMPEVYCGRDPLSPNLQTSFAITNMTSYRAGTDEVLIHKLIEVSDRFVFFDCVKTFTMHADNWLMEKPKQLPENHIIVLDLEVTNLKIIPKLNFIYIQKFLVFLLEGMPVRLSQVHVVNCPPFCDYLYSMVKSVLPYYVRNLIHFHQDHTGLHQFVDKKYLPKEYDGEAESMSEQNAIWVKEICEKRKTFLDDNFWKADLTKKLKHRAADNFMSGSFKSLTID